MTLYKKNIGQFGEDLACDFLKKRGYTILERNIKLSYQEIDIISSFEKKLIFVEVKTRTSSQLGFANEALRSCQIKNLKKAIMTYCCSRKRKVANIRLDFVAIDIDREKKIAKIKHYKDII